jgi:hypothetical protein
MKKECTVLFIGILTLLILVTGFVTADPLIPAHNETMGLQIGTVASIDGQLKEDNEVVWETTNGVLDDTLDPLMPSWPIPLDADIPGDYIFWIGNPILDEIMGSSRGEIQYYTVYTEDTAANLGHIGYSNQFSLSNANKAPGESNIEATRAIVFTGDTAGSLSSNERLILDGAGQFNFAGDSLICPFGTDSDEFIPAFCNKVEMGSDLLISSGSVATNAKERFIAKSSDNPLTTDYLIQVSGANSPAKGSVSAYINAQTREGDVDILGQIPFICENCCPECENPDLDLGTFYWVDSNQVSEVKLADKTSISGEITLFEKIMHYESGVTL